MIYRCIHIPIMCIHLLLNIAIHAAMIDGPRFKTEEDVPTAVKKRHAWIGFFTGCMQQAVIMRTALDLEAKQQSTDMLLISQWPLSIVVAAKMICMSKTHLHELTRIDSISARIVFNRIWPRSCTSLTIDERQAEFSVFYAGYHAMRTAAPPLQLQDAHEICGAYNSLLTERVKNLYCAGGYAVAAVLGPPVGYVLLQLMD